MAKNASIEEMRHGSVTAVEVTDAHGRRRTIDLGELNEADLALCEQFGYQPVFKRSFGYFSAFSFAVSISGLFSTVTTTFYYPLIAGGVSSAVWCWLIAGVGCMCIALSVAELVSAYPTCGGLYYTVSRLAPPRWVPSISWLVGWMNLLGQVAGVASSEYGSAQILLGCISLATDGSYAPTIGQTVGVMAGLTFLCGVINSLPTFWMEKITKGYVVFHVIVLVSCSIALLVMTPKELRHDASYVFTYVPPEPASGWSPVGWSFLFGFLSCSWRTVFAFARDNLLPFSNFWTIISPRTQTPLIAVWMSVFLSAAINLIALANYAAISGVFSVTAIALDWSYCIPIASKLVWGKFTPGPWHLGRFSYAVNLYAVIWTAFVTVIFVQPTLMPATALNSNYAPAFLALILGFAGIYWVLYGRRVYTGPIIQANMVEIPGESPGAVLEKEEASSGNASQEMDRKS